MFHVGQNLILDSDLYLLHVEVSSNSLLYEMKFRNYLASHLLNMHDITFSVDKDHGLAFSRKTLNLLLDGQ